MTRTRNGTLTMSTLMIAVLGIAILLLGARASSAAAGPPFYDPPNKLPKGHGELIRKQAANKIVQIKGARYTKKVLYTSKSPQGEEIAVSGTVSLPKGKAPKKGFPVITYAHGTTGVADSCAPSRASKNNPVNSYVDYVDPVLKDWVTAGYAVVRTDYPGLGTPGPHPYLIGKSEGRGVLDIVRAARDLDKRVGKRYLITGHSQGGQAALFAARYANWTPDLKLRGTAAYAPASHLLQQAESLPALTAPSGLSALAVTILYGATTANPAIKAENVLEPEPLSLYPFLDRECLPILAQPDRYGGIAPSELLQDGQPDAAFSKVLAGMNPAIDTDKPIYLLQGEADSTVFPFFTDALDGELRELGDKVTYLKYPGVNHGGIVEAAEPDVLPWMKGRLPTG